MLMGGQLSYLGRRASAPALFGAGFGVLVARSGISASTPAQWNVETYDYSSWHDNSTNPDRLIAPAGQTLLRHSFCLNSAGLAAGGMTLSGSAFRGQGGFTGDTTGNDTVNAFSAPIVVTAGQYFGTTFNGQIGASDNTWASVEVLDPSLRYALVYKSGTQSLSANTFATLTFDSEVADVGGWHDTVTDNHFLTVPSGVTLVRITANFEASAQSGQAAIQSLKNGASYPGGFIRDCDVASGVDILNAVSAIVVVTAGDDFEVQALTNSASTVSAGQNTWFSIEEIPASTMRCLCTLNATQAVASSVDEPLEFTAEVYDTHSIHSSGSPTKFIGPAGGTEARISFNVQGPNVAANVQAYATKNGAGYPGACRAESETAGSDSVNGISAWVPYTPGDEFEVWVRFNVSGVTLAISDYTWVCAEFR